MVSRTSAIDCSGSIVVVGGGVARRVAGGGGGLGVCVPHRAVTRWFLLRRVHDCDLLEDVLSRYFIHSIHGLVVVVS